MLRSHTFFRLISCTLLLLHSTSGESQPHVAHGGTPDVDSMDSRRALLLQAVKTGILNSLGMDKEPRPTQKASEQELMKMYQLYRAKMQEMRRNSSPPVRENWQSTTSNVLFPVEPIKVFRRRQHPGQHKQWYRAVFLTNSTNQTGQSLARAELKISWQVLDKLTPVMPEVRQEVRVGVSGMKLVRFAAWTNTDSGVSGSQNVILDISPAVETWMRTGGQPLVVDIGIVVVSRDPMMITPLISLELSLTQPRPAQRTRLRRSNKEDDCDERGWCCRKSVTVSFKDIGWTDWVVAPEEYTMHFCDGTCPHNYKPASIHTQVKSRLHQITKGGTPRPCCVPAAYEPMLIIHYDSQGKLKVTPFNDFIVSKCHCA